MRPTATTSNVTLNRLRKMISYISGLSRDADAERFEVLYDDEGVFDYDESKRRSKIIAPVAREIEAIYRRMLKMEIEILKARIASKDLPLDPLTYSLLTEH